MKTIIKYRIIDVLIFIGIAYFVSRFTNLNTIEYSIGFFIGYFIFVIGPIIYKIKI